MKNREKFSEILINSGSITKSRNETWTILASFELAREILQILEKFRGSNKVLKRQKESQRVLNCLVSLELAIEVLQGPEQAF